MTVKELLKKLQQEQFDVERSQIVVATHNGLQVLSDTWHFDAAGRLVLAVGRDAEPVCSCGHLEGKHNDGEGACQAPACPCNEMSE